MTCPCILARTCAPVSRGRPDAMGASGALRALSRAMRLCAAGLMFVWWPVASANAQEDNRLLRDVRLTGVKSVDDRELRDALATQATACRSILYSPICFFSRAPIFARRRYLNSLELRRDELRIRLFYWRRGYRDVQVRSRVERVGGGQRVVFDIAENAPTVITSLEIAQPDSVLPERTLKSRLTLAAGDPLDLIVLDSARVRLQQEWWDRGHGDAKVTLDTLRVSNELNQGPVGVTVASGRVTTVQSVEVEGNRAISARTIGRLMRLTPGSLYRQRDLLASQRALYLSGLFNNVELSADPSPDSAKVIRAIVAEGPLHRLDVTGGVTTYDFLQVQAEATRYHFMGGARRLTTRVTLSNLLAPQLNGAGVFYDVTSGLQASERAIFLRPTYSASIEFAQPWAFGRGNELATSVYAHRRSQPGVVVDRGAGATFGFTRELSTRANGTLGYTFEVSSIEASDVYFCVSVGLCVTSAIDAVSQANPLAPVSLVARFNSTDDALLPTRGARARIDLEHASQVTGSDFAYNRATITASTYRRLARTVVVAGRVRLGAVRAMGRTNQALGITDPAIDAVIHPRKSFFAGGSQSVRGYGENQLGPRVLTIDPTRLTDTSLTNHCTRASIANGSCDPNIVALKADAFQPRPLGGSAVAEASIELRFPLLRAHGVSGALFVDGAVVGTRRFTDLIGSTATITPGFGIRVNTPAGPVRLDLGVRPQIVERLPVITQVTGSDSTFNLVALKTPRRYDQAEATGGFLKQIISRLTLHLAIGPAF